MNRGDRIEAFLAALAEAGVEAAVARIWQEDREVAAAAYGPGVHLDSWFDLASLTKPFVATLAAKLDEVGSLALSSRLDSVWPEAPRHLASERMEDLLRHRAGLRPWFPFFLPEATQGRDPLAIISQPDLAGAARPLYSDLGYILWSRLAERVLGGDLAGLLEEFVWQPLGLSGSIAASPGARSEVVGCSLDNRVESRLAAEFGYRLENQHEPRLGVPQDANARTLVGRGECAGHAGLFGSAAAVGTLATAWLREGLLAAATHRRGLATEHRYALGWWRVSRLEDLGGELSPASFGMVGFTGPSCWVEPERQLVAVLLCHRPDTEFDLLPWRRRFHRLARELSG